MFWFGELIARGTLRQQRRISPVPAPAPVERAQAAYLGLAIGDALGASVEFMTPKEIRHQFGVHREIVGGGWLHLRPGQVTDDTTMSLALGEAILAAGGVDAQRVAEAFDRWMRGKPVDIGNTVRRNLVAFRRSGVPESRPSEHDAGNGAAMRVLPVALACFGLPERQTIAACRAQAHVTHHNEVSDAACETLALMVQDLLAGRALHEVRARRVAALNERVPAFAGTRRPRENPSGYVVDTLQAVLQALFASDGFEDCLVDVVNRGGDADTTGAIAGMLAGACYGLAAIPARWLRALDPAVRAQCAAQAEALLGACARQPVA
ncbi:ADP-ribosyl-[dinitrogen reductase] hydrolase [Azospira restricta]|uniref:ADP-ribosyl-[dinitrogen reductase] hydrolase n=1 Tax=Azospira restricta TaxID=404405 RepID=UPI001EF11345|nr:ADP-ribosyl-[dinitrogen reductase] hydrolase [Azospira restricta]